MNLHTLLSTFVDDLAPECRAALASVDPDKSGQNIVPIVDNGSKLVNNEEAKDPFSAGPQNLFLMDEPDMLENKFLSDLETCKFCNNPFT